MASNGVYSTMRAILIAAIVTLCYTPCLDAQDLGIQYHFPSSGAKSVARGTTIILRPGSILNPGTIDTSRISVFGSFSGKHEGTLILADDQKTLVFKPFTLFIYCERVHVKLKPGIFTADGLPVDSLAFYFTVQSHPVVGQSSTGTMTAVPIESGPMEYLLDTSEPGIGSLDRNPYHSDINLATVYSGTGTPKVQVTASCPISCDVKLFDSFGREAAMLAHGPISEGAHIFNLDMLGLPNGIYYCVLSGEDRMTVLKQILISH
ncbi:MAG TPA: hypothetical protein VG537_04855 [Candidatus Kapabacteria bacterium]|nr:hypothetical protein [Candidatus Kapabacteria bacterium]